MREGKDAAIGPLVGAVMRATQSRADAARVRRIARDLLAEGGA